ncbi:diguanylate cyclase [Oceanotoga teriensis]|jgi:diguanylate cyclase (GGDEF)-like protein|uniref:diguanylate cyclase n=1 Tax=Oceanotoga teriensis TaxID=515440 RepID=UPI002713A06E|nr:diguanylate cyclase [Oceanotoga teriensis]MDO7976371.1 diguanylate cyclase [Oceanotoga teriensis]
MIYKINDHIFRIGNDKLINHLQNNIYLLNFDEEKILFGCGSIKEFDSIKKSISEISEIKDLDYIVLRDTSNCSAINKFEDNGFRGKIITHWRTGESIKLFNLKSEFYFINQNKNNLNLKNGEQLKFLPIPYTPHPENFICVYNDFLFSGNIFSCFNKEFSIYSNKNSIKYIKSYLEYFISSEDLLENIYFKLKDLQIQMILPTYGGIIKENINLYLEILKDLKCGKLNFHKNIDNKNDIFLNTINEIIELYIKSYGLSFLNIFKSTEIKIKDNKIIKTKTSSKKLLNLFLEIIYHNYGVRHLIIAEDIVKERLVEMEIPEIFNSYIYKNEKEIEDLKEEKRKLEDELNKIHKRSLINPLTKLYNGKYFLNYLNTEIAKMEKNNEKGYIIFIDTDNLSKINFDYGNDAGDETLKIISYILRDLKRPQDHIFKLKGALFAYYISDQEISKEKAYEIADEIRNTISLSERFIEHITVSVAVVETDEIKDNRLISDEMVDEIYNLAMIRLKIAKNTGMNMVYSDAMLKKFVDTKGKILIVDTDEMHKKTLKELLENLGYLVFTCSDGETSLKLIKENFPDLVITSIMLPKIDGFRVREEMIKYSSLKEIMYIIIDYEKSYENVKRAYALDISYFFKKPYSTGELLEIIKNKIRS